MRSSLIVAAVVSLTLLGIAPTASAGGAPTVCADIGTLVEPDPVNDPGFFVWLVEGQEINADLLVLDPDVACELRGSTVKGEVIAQAGSFGVGLFDSTIEGDLQVKEGSSSFHIGATVKGSVSATGAFSNFIGPGSLIDGDLRLGADAGAALVSAELKGNYTCRDCYFGDLIGSKVGGNVAIRGAGFGTFVVPDTEEDGSKIADTEINGNLTVTRSRGDKPTPDIPPEVLPLPPAPFLVEDAFINGNVRFTRNEAPIAITGSTVNGNINVVRNVLLDGEIPAPPPNNLAVEPTISGNDVSGNIRFARNTGAEASIADNTIDGNLHCQRNAPVPVGGSNNVDGNKKGQCRTL